MCLEGVIGLIYILVDEGACLKRLGAKPTERKDLHTCLTWCVSKEMLAIGYKVYVYEEMGTRVSNIF